MVGMNPVEFLEEVQHAYMISSFGEIIDYDEMYSNGGFFDFLQREYNFKLEEREKVMKSLQEMRSEHVISRYENPYYYKYFRDIISNIHRIKDKFLDCKEQGEPLFGTVEFDMFYAQIRCPDSSMPPIILLYSGIIQFAHDITNVLTKAFPIQVRDGEKIVFGMEPQKIWDSIQSNKWIERRFTDIVFSIFFYGNVDMCDVSQPENDYLYRNFSNALADSFLTFIVAHECAHYYLGHLGTDAVKGIVTVGNVQYESIIPDWEQEFDADYIGVLLTIPVLLEKNMDIQVILGGMYIAMWILSIMESLRIKAGEEKTTHPPAKDRLLQVKKKLQNIMQDDLRMLEVYDMLFSVLWDRFTVIAKNVEDRVLAGRPIADVTYEQIKEAIYQSP
ncbi:MAG: hypothetical protein J1E98_00415 [Lachnospiraceae bacterium]|nr:hypothetical protein [Lachnospiraceae bacterium]